MHITARRAALTALLLACTAQGSAAAPRRAGSRGHAAAPAAAAPIVWREVDPDNLLIVETTKGRILAELTPALAPDAAARVRTLARQHFYDGLAFFRVIDGFMDQTGDPKNTGEGNSSLPNLKGRFSFRRGPDLPYGRYAEADAAAETNETGFVGSAPVSGQPSDLMMMTADGKATSFGLFCPGTLGMARASDPDSANSQFFFMRGAYPSLNGAYMPFGRVLIGQEVVTAVKVGEPPVDPDRMTSVRVASDLPAATRPRVRVIDTGSAAFPAYAAAQIAQHGGDLAVCDLPLPAEAIASAR